MNQYEHDGLTDEEYVAWLRKLAKDAKECGGHKLCLELEVAAARIDDLLLHNRILKRSRDAALSELAQLRALSTYGRQGGKVIPDVDVERIADTFGWTPEEVVEFLNDYDEYDEAAVMIDEKIYEAVAEERMKQREKGDEFDKTNSRNDWITYICRYASGAGDKLWSRQDLEFREAMVKVAALAFAAIEAHDNGYLTEAADEIPTQGGKPL